MHNQKMHRLIKKRYFRKLLAISILITGIALCTVHLNNNTSDPIPEYSSKIKYDYIMKEIMSFDPNIDKPSSISFFEDDMISNQRSINNNSLGHYINRGENIEMCDVNTWNEALNYSNLKNKYLRISSLMEMKLNKFHTSFLNHLNKDKKFNKIIKNHAKMFKGNGIVIGGGGYHSLMTASVLHVLKNVVNSTLPVEVMIPDVFVSKSDEQFCAFISKEYDNVKCIYLRNHFTPRLLQAKYKFAGFQYKALALLISSFENVLLLDADNYPIKNIDHLFDDMMYKQKGLVVWPDFWRRFTHPTFYESAGITIDLNEKIRDFTLDLETPIRTNDGLHRKNDRIMHEYKGTISDASSESGQMLFNKKKHFKTLILSLFYNTYGPRVFYHLLSQYSPGQGDKETFIAAAHVLDQINKSPRKSYYQVISQPSMDGFLYPDGFKAVGYYQKDLKHDLELYKTAMLEGTNGHETMARHFSAYGTREHTLFLHLNFPKFNPLELAFNNEFCIDGVRYRAITGKLSLGGLDIEKEIISFHMKLLCADNKMDAAFDLRDDVTKMQVCNYLNDRMLLLTSVPLDEPDDIV